MADRGPCRPIPLILFSTTSDRRSRLALLCARSVNSHPCCNQRATSKWALWEVYVHGRDRRRGESVADRVRAAEFLRTDLASPAAVRDLAATVGDRIGRLDAFVLNGPLACEECRLAWDAIEETFAVDQLAPTCSPTSWPTSCGRRHPPAWSSPPRPFTRGANPSSTGQIDCTGDYDALDAYVRSKIVNLLFAVELADRFGDASVSVNAVHLGFVPGSGLYRYVGPLFQVVVIARVLPFVATSVADGAKGIVYLSDSTAVEDVTGAYFHRTERTEPDSRVDDPKLQDRLWSVCAILAGVDPDWP